MVSRSSFRHLFVRSALGMAASVTILVMGLSGCEFLDDAPIETATPGGEVYWDAHVQPLLDRKCGSCHAGDAAAAGLRLTSWEEAIQGSEWGEAFIAFNPDKSVMLRLMTTFDRDPHPGGKNRLTDDEVELLRRWIADGARGPAGLTPFEDSADRMYVAHEGAPAITVVETNAEVILARLDLTDYGFSPRARARHVAVEPDGSFWYASITSTRWDEPAVVAKFNRSNTLVAKAQVDSPGQLLVHPSRDELYVSVAPDIDDDGVFHRRPDAPRHLSRLRRSDLQRSDVSVIFREAFPLALRPQQDVLFSSSMEVDQMVILDPLSTSVSFFDIRGIKHLFRHLAISPDGYWMWASGFFSGTATWFDIADPTRIVQRQSLYVGYDPRQIAYHPNGRLVYVAVRGSDVVQVIDQALGYIDYEIRAAAMQEPVGAAIIKEGSTLVVSAENATADYRGQYRFPEDPAPGMILFIDTTTRQVRKALESAPRAASLAVR
jgi:hypothetical protein